MTEELRWYDFHQNNSGGYFTGPAIHIYVQAYSTDEANDIAEANGAYFGGEGDCDCCGPRWSGAWDVMSVGFDPDKDGDDEAYGRTEQPSMLVVRHPDADKVNPSEEVAKQAIAELRELRKEVKQVVEENRRLRAAVDAAKKCIAEANRLILDK